MDTSTLSDISTFYLYSIATIVLHIISVLKIAAGHWTHSSKKSTCQATLYLVLHKVLIITITSCILALPHVAAGWWVNEVK